MSDKVMQPFAKDLRNQIENRWSSIHERLGLTLDDLKTIPGGDVGIGMIAPSPGKAALAIVVDVTGKKQQTKEMLQKVTDAQLKRNIKRSELTVEECPDVVIQFDLPEPEEEKEAGQSTLRGSEKFEAEKAEAEKAKAEAAKNKDKKGNAAEDKVSSETAPRFAFYCLTGDLLVVSDNLDVLKKILARAVGREKHSLTDHKAFQVVMQRCKNDSTTKAAAQIRWFIHPLGYAEAARAATPEYRRRKGKSILEIMRNQGLGAIQGIGGFFDFSVEGYEMIHRTAIYAPPPYEKSMKMLVLPNGADLTPQSWVPRDIATYTTLYFDINNAFKNFGALFDELFGQGEQGVWEEVKQSLKEDPNGPQIDLYEDLIKHLGQRISMLSDYQLPITPSSERLLFSIETTKPKAVALAIEKLMKNDPTAKRRDVNGQIIWEIVEDESPTPEVPEISFGDAPAVTPVHPPKKKHWGKAKDSDNEDEEKEKRLLPHAAITVWQGNLLIASHLDFLLKIIAPAKKPELLKDDVDYRLVDEQIKKMEPKAKCIRVFSRTDEEYRPTYELIRQNKMPESETMLARLMNGLFGEGKKGVVREQRIDGSQLPEYQVVRRYLGTAGFQATSESEGWFLKGFTLGKE
jgi:hypothetical protein